MAKQQAPAFQFYPQDFLAGTADMTAEQVGGYIRLLCHLWIRPKGLANDDESLCRLAGVENDVLSVVKRKLSERKNGMLLNKRLELERRKQREYSRKQAENANKRWHKNGDATALPPHQSGMSQTDALHPHLQLPPSPSSFGVIPGGVKLLGNGKGRAGPLPPPDAVRKLFAEMDPAALETMPGAAIQKACMFVGLHHKTASRAANRNDISAEYFLGQYAEVVADTSLENPLAVLAIRLKLAKSRTFRNQSTPAGVIKP